MKKKILVVVAHPDDEVLGCGGTLAKLSKEGYNISLLIIGEGLASRFKSKKSHESKIFKKLYISTKKSAKILGIKSFEILKFPDNKLDKISLIDIIKPIEKKIFKFQPNIIFTHHIGDLNIDHELISKAVITATRPVPSHVVKEIYSFEVPSSTEWSYNEKNSFIPNYFVNIEKTISFKIKALKAYDSEMRKFPHARSYNSIVSLSKWRGSSAGFKNAEAFKIIRILKD